MSLLPVMPIAVRHGTPGGIGARRRGVIEGSRPFTSGGGVNHSQADPGVSRGPRSYSEDRRTYDEGPEVLEGADPSTSKGA
ncbi:MAG: hypothetical protein ACREXX_19540 [Gammaproteobacteria bacterium]